ncbi:hypothetical protein BATDEDRAFT_22242 [Batrachochytrium dendrobatidis JAM81]|uniref:Protein transport protein BOS1 n=1 Tax=Batrachochytrium dendrobatidis (strain JAM81 / FGSC 10211) TaxID=684364 RepID=F4NTA2_BATDJ|nr:uncharacterized protein BATDEDRAFT_22242 [Batrachochytrium dendrobatidis JAM81]EGF83497.1 hypothetical protein BATDEDRAFT_22242 [Batrachochytrium dendrobatidis JAM81]KAK5668001.1 Vesicle transport protein S20 [Batrachochytrium dendrobatidis]|eukprot:XP_006675509.1 hypothetical protein BATDEDRAFT_22242 [Batrachochytrium dendrobatidis JAM81]
MTELLRARLDGLISNTEQNIASLENESSKLTVTGLATTIPKLFLSLKTLIEESEDALLDIKRPSQKAALAQSIAQQKQAVKLLQQRFQTALVTARKAIKTKAQNDRESLLALGSASKTDRSNAAAIQASNDITYGLKQAVQMISAEVERSIETVNTLEQSTNTLNRTQQEYSMIGDRLGVSKSIISSLNSRDWMDRALLGVGLLVFTLTMMYIIGRRMWIPGYAWISGECAMSTSWFCF